MCVGGGGGLYLKEMHLGNVQKLEIVRSLLGIILRMWKYSINCVKIAFIIILWIVNALVTP